MDKHLNDSYKLRIPAELKARIAESAKAHNRSMNADIVARLEKSFEGESENQSLELVVKNLFDRLRKEQQESIGEVKQSLAEIIKNSYKKEI